MTYRSICLIYAGRGGLTAGFIPEKQSELNWSKHRLSSAGVAGADSDFEVWRCMLWVASSKSEKVSIYSAFCLFICSFRFFWYACSYADISILKQIVRPLYHNGTSFDIRFMWEFVLSGLSTMVFLMYWSVTSVSTNDGALLKKCFLITLCSTILRFYLTWLTLISGRLSYYRFTILNLDLDDSTIYLIFISPIRKLYLEYSLGPSTTGILETMSTTNVLNGIPLEKHCASQSVVAHAHGIGPKSKDEYLAGSAEYIGYGYLNGLSSPITSRSTWLAVWRFVDKIRMVFS